MFITHFDHQGPLFAAPKLHFCPYTLQLYTCMRFLVNNTISNLSFSKFAKKWLKLITWILYHNPFIDTCIFDLQLHMLADFDLIVEIKVKTEKSGATQLISVILSDTNLPVSVNPSPLPQLNLYLHTVILLRKFQLHNFCRWYLCNILQLRWSCAKNSTYSWKADAICWFFLLFNIISWTALSRSVNSFQPLFDALFWIFLWSDFSTVNDELRCQGFPHICTRLPSALLWSLRSYKTRWGSSALS